MTATLSDAGVEVAELDPRHPLVRMPAFLDDDSMELITLATRPNARPAAQKPTTSRSSAAS